MAKKKKHRKGSFTPSREDIEAFEQGKLTPAAKRNDRVVDRCFKAQEIFQRATESRDKKMMQQYERLNTSDTGFTVRTTDQTKQVTFKKRTIQVANANAMQAQQIIDQYVADVLSKAAIDEQEKQLVQFLKSVLHKRDGTMRMTGIISKFLSMKFSSSSPLHKAQRLLREGFDYHDTEISAYCEVLDEDRGQYVRAKYDEKKKEWVPA